MQQNFVFKCALVLNLISLLCVPTQAQVIPDGSLGFEESTVTPNQTVKGTPSDLISGGAIRGSNLFHSFEDFDINSGKGVYFSSPNGVNNILTRITGNKPSNILGVLGVIGNANLFFLNPNGIFFGSNARLDLNGSFLGTTAKSIILRDGFQFSANDPQAPSVLTVNVPIGLGFTGSPGSIEVQGGGHSLTQMNEGPDLLQETGLSTAGLRVQPGKTIALVGGNVTFNGGIVAAPAGQIEVSSVTRGNVKIDPSFKFNYLGTETAQNIELKNLSLIDASGLGLANINFYADQITLASGSLVLLQSQEANSEGNIDINAKNSLRIIGNTLNPNPGNPPSPTTLRTAIITKSFLGSGANINISTKDLTLQFSGGIGSNTFSSVSGGKISIDASNSIQLIGISPVDPTQNFNVIGTTTNEVGSSGEIKISTRNILIQDGGAIGSASTSRGNSGNVNVNASEKIEISGNNPVSLSPSFISSVALASGKAGNIDINTHQIKILDGGSVASSTQRDGLAGDVTINAPGFVDVSGTASGSLPGLVFPSYIVSSGNQIDPLVAKALGLASTPSGDSGNLTINTNILKVRDGAQVAVKNDGIGNAGKLTLNARSIFLDNKGSITAATASGEGGNIFLNSQSLELRRGSNITATAGNRGNGGNINIDTDLLTVLERSEITADAFQGRGGNIQINTQGFFRSPDSKISASSNFGINGTVEINTLFTDPSNGSVELPQETVDATGLIAQGCPGNVAGKSSSFTVTGRGGLPENPFAPLNAEAPLWTGWRSLANAKPQSTPTKDRDTLPKNKLRSLLEDEPISLVEADSWQYDPQGNIVFTASVPTAPSLPSLQCHALDHLGN